MRTDVAQGKKLSLTRKSGLTAALLLFLCALAPALALGVCTLADTDVALAADGDYEFTVGTSEGFTFGSPYNIASEKGYPSVTLDFKGTVDGGSGFWYYLGTETELPENVQWTELNSDSNPIDADGAYTFTLNSIIEVTDYYERYIFFRGGNPTNEEYYIDSTARKIVLIDSNKVKPSIDKISAVTGDGTTNYDLTMQNGNWTNTAIRITITAAVPNFTGNPNAVKFRYKLGENGEERPFDSVAAGENEVVGTVTIGGNNEGDVTEYAGEISFIVADAASANTSTSPDNSYYLHIDMNAPDFRVNATVQTAAGATVAYSANDWTPYSVTMQLSFNNALFSGTIGHFKSGRKRLFVKVGKGRSLFGSVYGAFQLGAESNRHFQYKERFYRAIDSIIGAGCGRHSDSVHGGYGSRRRQSGVCGERYQLYDVQRKRHARR